MKRIILLCFGLSLLIISCSTAYYSRMFRLEDVHPGTKGNAPAADVITGPLGTVGSWNLGIRVISTFESNERQRVLGRDTFTVSLTATSTDRRSAPPDIDSLLVVFKPTNDHFALPFQRRLTDSVSYAPEIWNTYRFSDVRIPKGVDTIEVRFAAKSPQLAVPEGREFILRLVRYEGKFYKFGIRPKGW